MWKTYEFVYNIYIVAHTATKLSKWDVPPHPRMLPLPLRETTLPRPIAAAAARVRASVGPDSTIASEFNVTKEDMAIVYMSQDPFFDSFEEVLDLHFPRHNEGTKNMPYSLQLLLHAWLVHATTSMTCM